MIRQMTLIFIFEISLSLSLSLSLLSLKLPSLSFLSHCFKSREKLSGGVEDISKRADAAAAAAVVHNTYIFTKF